MFELSVNFLTAVMTRVIISLDYIPKIGLLSFIPCLTEISSMDIYGYCSNLEQNYMVNRNSSIVVVKTGPYDLQILSKEDIPA